MIEYRHLKKGKPGNVGWMHSWMPLNSSVTVQPEDFEYYELRIFGVVYKKHNAAFEQALNEAKMWKRLSAVS